LKNPPLLCRIVWAEKYCEKKEKMYAGRLRYPKENNLAIELLNFLEEAGRLYGFTENRGAKININRLGAEPAAKWIDGVKIIFCSLEKISQELVVVGWYDNARVYRESQVDRGLKRGEWPYYFQAQAKNGVLLRPTERQLRVPVKESREERGFIGQRCVFYPSESEHYDRFLEAMSLTDDPYTAAPSKKRVSTEEYQEGQRISAEVMRTVRNPALVAAAKRHHGTCCLACGFDFESAYGSLGEGFIEVHHKISLAESGKRKTTVDDVDVLCSNCHRMIHRNSKPLTLAELKRFIRIKTK
jgi:5-methylcytosine-specific restriction protein A